MPATPPVRNAMRMARRSPDSWAAAATRTFPRTASHIPVNPASAENKAPTRKKMERPSRTEVPPSAGRISSRKKISTTNTPMVLNWRRRYAAAPSWIAVAISCIFGEPWLAASTSRTRTPATASASSAITSTTMTHVRLAPATVTAPLATAG